MRVAGRLGVGVGVGLGGGGALPPRCELPLGFYIDTSLRASPRDYIDTSLRASPRDYIDPYRHVLPLIVY